MTDGLQTQVIQAHTHGFLLSSAVSPSAFESREGLQRQPASYRWPEHYLEVHMVEDLSHPCVEGVDAQLRDALKLLMRDEALRTPSMMISELICCADMKRCIPICQMLLSDAVCTFLPRSSARNLLYKPSISACVTASCTGVR